MGLANNRHSSPVCTCGGRRPRHGPSGHLILPCFYPGSESEQMEAEALKLPLFPSCLMGSARCSGCGFFVSVFPCPVPPHAFLASFLNSLGHSYGLKAGILAIRSMGLLNLQPRGERKSFRIVLHHPHPQGHSVSYSSG